MSNRAGFRDKVEILLNDLVDNLDTQDVNALYYAAIPQWFSTDLYQALNPENAEQDLAWIQEFSFIVNLPGSSSDFMMQPMEREIMNEIFLDREPDQYRQAHSQAFNYWLEYPYGDPFVQAQNVLYHHIFVDSNAARGELIDLFELYADERQLGALEQLLKSAEEACNYQDQLKEPSKSIKELVPYMEVRQAQLQSNWKLSKELLKKVKVEAEPMLQPFLTRAYGFAELGLGNYAGAIDYFQEAAAQFLEMESILGEERAQVERADTLVALGDAYVGLAEATISLDERRRRLNSKWGLLQGIYYMLLSLPLAVYLTRALGFRVWLPQLWVIWRDVDWVKADLYAQATKQYRAADRLLADIDRPDKDLVAEEKLANLYLSVGDASEAHSLFEKLLDEMELSAYRKVRIQVGLGQTEWLLGNEEAAWKVLTGTLPELTYYADRDMEAQVRTVLGMIAAQSPEPESSLEHFQRALDLLLDRDSPNLVAATDVAEQLDVVAQKEALAADDRSWAINEASRVSERQYPVHQRHRITRFFQQGFLFAVVVLGGLGLLNAIRVQPKTVVPNITFHVSPLLEPLKDFTPVLSQGVTSLDVSNESKVEYVVSLLVLAFLGYLITVTVSGILWLRTIDHHKAQETRESAVVRLTKEGVSVGEGSGQKVISFADVTRLVINNTRLFRRPISESYLLLDAESVEPVAVEGSTSHYGRLQQHIEDRLPETAVCVDQSHSLLISMAGVILLFTVLLYLILAILNYFANPTLQTAIGGSPYSVATLYPYLLLGFLIPPLWWFVWKPLQRRHRLDIYDWSPFLLIISGLLVALLVVILGFRYRLTTPDLYPALVAISLVLAGVVALTVRAVQRRRAAETMEIDEPQPLADEIRDEDNAGVISSALHMTRRVEDYSRRMPSSLRYVLFIALYLLLIAVAGLMIVYLFREIGAYHLKIDGDALRNQAIALKDRPDADWETPLESAQGRYTEAIKLAETENWQVYHRETLADIYSSRAHAALMSGTKVISPTLTTSETLRTDTSNYERALQDYTKVIDLQPEAPEGYLWRGFTNHVLGNDDDALDDYACAVLLSGLTQEKLSKWINSDSCPVPAKLPEKLQLEPENVIKALTGRGWIYFSKANSETESKEKSEKNYEDALVNFLLAAEYASILDSDLAGTLKPISDQAHIEASLGLGYANYKTERYGEAMEAWKQALERDPGNVTLLTSIATGYWRQGTIPEGSADETGSDRCSNDALDEDEKRRAVGLLEESINFFDQSLAIEDQPDEDRAFTYRTRAQVQYLRRNCPGYDKTVALQEAIDSYSEAIKWDEENSHYWYMRSRLRYALWANTSASGPAAREIIVQALGDINETLRLDEKTCPEANYEPCSMWYSLIYRNAVGGTLEKGDEYLDQGDYENARDTYLLLPDNVPDLPEIYLAHLRLGLAELALGNVDVSREWFKSGTLLATAADDKKVIGEAWQELKDLSDTDSSIDPEPIRAIFEELDFDYDAAVVFGSGARALASGDLDKAREAYAQGSDIAIELGDLEVIKLTLLDLLQEAEDGYEEILDDFYGRLPQMASAASDEDAVKEAFDLAFIAWTLGEADMAGLWYQEGIRRTAVTPNTYGDGLLPSRDALAELWSRGVAVNAESLIAATDAYRTRQLEAYPDLLEGSWYWRFQSWFKYHIGLKAFLAGDADAAFSVLESGKIDSEVAAKVDDYNKPVDGYFHQGAWSGYLSERADLAEEDGDYEAALADYVSALEAYPEPVTDGWTKGELVNTALAAGYAAFKLGEYDVALESYEFAVKQAEVFEVTDRLQEARDTLQAEGPEDDTAVELQKEILELLETE